LSSRKYAIGYSNMSKNILVVGSGLSGCTLARILHDRGHNVTVVEQKDCIGGLCVTEIDKEGHKYEPFGARTFHTSNLDIVFFVLRFAEFNDYIHRKGMIINGKLLPLPITRSSLKHYSEHERISQELRQRPDNIDKTNFETACVSIFGQTLYDYFIRNYTEKMWGADPMSLEADWAPKRLEFREDNDDALFRSEWQGLPKCGYTKMLQNMLGDIHVIFGTSKYEPASHDMIFHTGPIDELLNYKHGRLAYRSIKFEYMEDEQWENRKFGTINLPQHERFIRKCNFTVLHQEDFNHARVQYQEPCGCSDVDSPMYPVGDSENRARFDLYLRAVCRIPNVCPCGRLGLFKYLDMDEAVESSIIIAGLADRYLDMSVSERYNRLQEIRSFF
jgi:UDP-galactopyranose mutase